MNTTPELFETKYLLPKHAGDRVLAALRTKALVPREFPHARLKTVYFDDMEQTSLYESLDGQLEKKKFRLREYIDPEGAAMGGARYSLEVKLRSDTRTSKIRELIYEELPGGYRYTTFRDLIDTFERVTGREMPLLRIEAAGEDLFADTTIFYERFRFDDPYEEARYNVDLDIRLVPGVRSGREYYDGIYLEHDIFEIKSAGPPAFPAYLKGLGIEPLSFSKFVWGNGLFM